jgi:hypothetical protein
MLEQSVMLVIQVCGATKVRSQLPVVLILYLLLKVLTEQHLPQRVGQILRLPEQALQVFGQTNSWNKSHMCPT